MYRCNNNSHTLGEVRPPCSAFSIYLLFAQRANCARLICGAVGTDESWLSQLLTELLLPDGAGRAFDGRWWIFELGDSTKAVLLRD